MVFTLDGLGQALLNGQYKQHCGKDDGEALPHSNLLLVSPLGGSDPWVTYGLMLSVASG